MDGRIVTPRLFIGIPNNVASVVIEDPIEAALLIETGTTVAVPDASTAVEVLVALGVTADEARWLTDPTGEISYGSSQAEGG